MQNSSLPIAPVPGNPPLPPNEVGAVEKLQFKAGGAVLPPPRRAHARVRPVVSELVLQVSGDRMNELLGASSSIIIASKLWSQDCSVDGRSTNKEKVEMNGNRGSALLFFLTGLGVGIALTVLFAPLSGAATRRLIGRKVEEGEDWVKDNAAAAQDYVRDHGEELRDRVKDVAEVTGRS
jgi:hypothetical protein